MTALLPPPQIKFIGGDIFNKIIRELTHLARAEVAAEIKAFQDNYVSDGPQAILARFDFTHIRKTADGCTIWQIHATNNYRAMLMFYDSDPSRAYWIYLFKKTKGNNRTEVKKGVSIGMELCKTMAGM